MNLLGLRYNVLETLAKHTNIKCIIVTPSHTDRLDLQDKHRETTN